MFGCDLLSSIYPFRHLPTKGSTKCNCLFMTLKETGSIAIYESNFLCCNSTYLLYCLLTICKTKLYNKQLYKPTSWCICFECSAEMNKIWRQPSYVRRNRPGMGVGTLHISWILIVFSVQLLFSLYTKFFTEQIKYNV